MNMNLSTMIKSLMLTDENNTSRDTLPDYATFLSQYNEDNSIDNLFRNLQIKENCTNAVICQHMTDTGYSKKVIVFGLPRQYDVPNPVAAMRELRKAFSFFGNLHLDWPRKSRYPVMPSDGIVFVTYTDAHSVYSLLRACQQLSDYPAYSVKIAGKVRQLKICAWELHNKTWWRPYAFESHTRDQQHYNIFLGGVPRNYSARDVANELDLKVGPVISVTIDTDTLTGAPRGSARAMLSTREGFVVALMLKSISMVSIDGPKDVELKPFMGEGTTCDGVHTTCENNGTIFCMDQTCLKYYCNKCWDIRHNPLPCHHPMFRGMFYNKKGGAHRQRGSLSAGIIGAAHSNGFNSSRNRHRRSSTTARKNAIFMPGMAFDEIHWDHNAIRHY